MVWAKVFLQRRSELAVTQIELTPNNLEDSNHSLIRSIKVPNSIQIICLPSRSFNCFAPYRFTRNKKKIISIKERVPKRKRLDFFSSAPTERHHTESRRKNRAKLPSHICSAIVFAARCHRPKVKV